MNALIVMHKKDPDKLEQIRIRLDEIIITIRQHEEEQHCLLQRAYSCEYAGG
ncbi:hypothetical protein IID10_03240 [candidate division KSB1 bacterium]|nr:hypothetical protein [candidate division KSB1 bacterium]